MGELETVVANLTERLSLAKAALAAKGDEPEGELQGESAKPEPVALKAEKVVGEWPPLPWDGESAPLGSPQSQLRRWCGARRSGVQDAPGFA